MKNTFFVFLISILLASCSAEKRFANRLIGTWNVSNYQEKYEATGESSYEASNIGTITFTKNKTGSMAVTIKSMHGDVTDVMDFTWKNDENTVNIKGDADSKFSKSWIVINNKRSSQNWRSTDGQGNTQKLELKKQEKK